MKEPDPNPRFHEILNREGIATLCQKRTNHFMVIVILILLSHLHTPSIKETEVRLESLITAQDIFPQYMLFPIPTYFQLQPDIIMLLLVSHTHFLSSYFL